MKTTLYQCDQTEFKVPMFDPVVANHFNNASNYTDPLISEINGGLYSDLFRDKKDLVFLDLGANIGLVSIYAAPACKRIVAIEPAPNTFAVLKAMTLKLPKIECAQLALAPDDGPVRFYVNGENTTASSTVNTFGEMWSARGFTLTSLLTIHQLEEVDVLKCDCEGAEGEALSYPELEKAAPIVKEWLIECHNCPSTTYQQKLERLNADFTKLGYKTRVVAMTIKAHR